MAAKAGASQHVSPEGKRLGVKAPGGKTVKTGVVLVRQHGSTILAGVGTRKGRDYTIYSVKNGLVKYFRKLGKKVVSVIETK
jgi:large subunit ribosomal protein L27